jgi:hypothetical protein
MQINKCIRIIFKLQITSLEHYCQLTEKNDKIRIKLIVID